MSTFQERLNAAADATTCQILQAGGSALVGAGAASIAAGGAGLVPITAGAVALLASNYACTWDPANPGPDPGYIPSGCAKVTSGDNLKLSQGPEGGPWGAFFNEFISLVDTGVPGPAGTTEWRLTVRDDAGNIQFYDLANTRAGVEQYSLHVLNGATCEYDTDPGAPPSYDPYTYTDPDTGCQLEVRFEGLATIDGGTTVQPVFQITDASPSSLQSSGGIISGCNFSPVIYMPPPPGGGGGGTTLPIPDPLPPGDPWWQDLLTGAVGGAAAAAVDAALDELFKTAYPAGTREIHAACDFKEDGTPETFSVTFPEETYQDRVLTSLNAIVDFQQQILLWKTPTCSGGGQSVTGDPVTITWRSDETSPVSAARVRKIFTYFDQSGTPQLDHVLHWKDFTFQAGAVIVSVNGVPLGKPQVWAATADEGKRVINHAAAIAGVDMSKAEWVITSPRSTRYGVPGTMRVYKDGQNKIWITKRDGPSGPVGLYG